MALHVEIVPAPGSELWRALLDAFSGSGFAALGAVTFVGTLVGVAIAFWPRPPVVEVPPRWTGPPDDGPRPIRVEPARTERPKCPHCGLPLDEPLDPSHAVW